MRHIAFVLSFLAFSSVSDAQTPVYLDDTKPLEERVSDALSRMTLEEKVALCHAQSKFSTAGCSRLGIPELYWSDGPHGVRMEINWNDWGHAGWTNDSCTAFPALTCLAATWNPEMSMLYGRNVGEEARYREKDVLLGPGVNIARTPLCGRNFEYMGEDPHLASKMVVPYIKGLQSNGVAASVKHYALNNQELWRGHINVKLSERALREIYLPAFRAAAVEGGAWTFMGAYNKTQGDWLCENETMLRKILKEEWQWDGVVVSDWGGTHSTVKAAKAGLDVEMGSFTNGLTTEATGFGYDDYYFADPYIKALKAGEVPMEVLDEQASRILRLIFRTAMNRQKPYGAMCTQEHYDACRTIGNEGIVLLKNNKNKAQKAPLLPIDAKKYQRILVVGENAVKDLCAGGGSSELKPRRLVTPLDGLKARFGSEKVQFAMGYKSGKFIYDHEDLVPQEKSDRLYAEALEAAGSADLIIYVGGLNKNWRQDCESGDRQTYNLPFCQDRLITSLAETGKPMVTVFLTGNAFAMPWIDKVDAIVQAWYIGSESGHPIADILSGDVCPSGKLPITYPVALADCGAHSFDTLCFPGDSIDTEYREDILVGYRWHDTKNVKPLFPFGYGLSYTTFEYGKAKVEVSEGAWTVSVPVTNTGSVKGKEVVQLYVGDDKASVIRPKKELKAFEKIEINPGETKTAKLTITEQDLKFWDEAKHEWTLEPGTFTFYVAASSADIKQKIKVKK